VPTMATAREISARTFITFLLLVVVLAGCAGSAHWFGAGSDVVILVSDATPAYAHVADALSKRLGGTPRVFHLDSDTRKAAAARRALADDGDVIVAIGAFALRSARALTDRRVIFCQVFHYEEPGLTVGATRGVKATPPLAKQFQAWKQLDPRLQHVVMVSGTGLADLPAEARRAGADAGIRITHIEARSDKDMLYAVRSLTPPVQGLWIAPDHRILSNPALRELLTYAVRHGIEVAGFSADLLSLGALMSAEADYADVAERVHELIAAPDTVGAAAARAIPLRRARIEVNSAAAKRYGLAVPPALARGVYGL